MKTFLSYLGIAFGSFLSAFGLNYFIVANGLAEGGFTGLALVIHYLTNLSIGSILIVLNTPLFVISWIMWGKKFVFKSLIGVAAISIAIDLTSAFSFKTHDLLLAALYGGVLSGVGIGIVLRSGATTGGVDIIARLIYEKLGISMGKVYFCFDFTIISLVAILFGLEKALYTLVALYVFSVVIDRLVEGGNEAREVTIISKADQVIVKAIINELERGATIFKASGAYTGKERNVLFVVISKHELLRLKRIVREIDPKAFIIVNSVYEVLGEGFSRHAPN